VLPLPQKFNRFHIPAPCFTKNVPLPAPQKSQLLPSSLPASSKGFRFHKNLTASTTSASPSLVHNITDFFCATISMLRFHQGKQQMFLVWPHRQTQSSSSSCEALTCSIINLAFKYWRKSCSEQTIDRVSPPLCGLINFSHFDQSRSNFFANF